VRLEGLGILKEKIQLIGTRTNEKYRKYSYDMDTDDYLKQDETNEM
jgi:hypothetical protein